MKISILPLSMRLEQNDLMFFWKCLNTIYEVDISKNIFFQTALTVVPTAQLMKDFS